MNSIREQEWVTIHVSVDLDFRDLAMDAAFQHGALGVVENPAGFDASFEQNTQITETLNAFQAQVLNWDAQAGFTDETVGWENWNANWQAYFQPVEIGKKLLILPEWSKQDPGDRLAIRIRPAMAFGTGTHETTRLCLEYLEETVTPGMTVLDVGTGSGILGLAALKLGAQHVDGVDNDELIADNVADNLALNGVTDQFDLHLGQLTKPRTPYDLLVVNIIRKNLFPLLPGYYEHVGPNSVVIVSGLLREEDALLRHLLQESPWQILNAKTKNEWIAYRCIVSS
jgi:ribosomal protein L11 methyltransferase